MARRITIRKVKNKGKDPLYEVVGGKSPAVRVRSKAAAKEIAEARRRVRAKAKKRV